MTAPRLNPRKLLLSKWTAVRPSRRERHFLVSRLIFDEGGVLQTVELEAVHSHRCRQLPWRDLTDTRCWQIGWR
ncbi:TIGR02450 family Trp-rich protein [Pseudomonas sp. JS3066]|uniref:TIGR02450 family Trp-rich protein n=1 Tax=unclassified Pseudomonas TaxID=196821 RepID=UPI000EAABD0C|nr:MULTISPECIES: TIGR02450 family Trp-rich protein [unclassified Pseudomonas]AYF90168.1 TIGR02450 family Trp-rich protein [Pseudomonas sp. DY-1]WVK92274.1 TIGR02450 family Trp-rich protein [Pseudomonas sp. JS3066]